MKDKWIERVVNDCKKSTDDIGFSLRKFYGMGQVENLSLKVSDI